MLQPQIHQYVVALDEDGFRVTLHGDAARNANSAFDDDRFFKAPWFAEAWAAAFRAKLNALGIAVKPESRVLDACCGQGFLGKALEESRKARPVFCDLSLAQLQALRRGSEPEQSAELEICSGDVTRLPFASEHFDLVAGNSFLHHVPDVPRALAEFHRVLRPGGMFILFHEPGERATFWESFPLSLFKDTTMRDGPCTDLWLFAPMDLERLARAAGFTRVQVLGSGVLGAVLLNWYQLLLIKTGIRHRLLNYPIYRLRAWLTGLELRWLGRRAGASSPSLMLVAIRTESS